MKTLSIGELKAKLPIVQGGMGVGISMAGLASAVANEGGIGVLSAACIGFFEPDFNKNFLDANIRALKAEIRKARALTSGILGVNVMGALDNFSDMVKTSISEGIDIVFAGAGLPLDLPGYLHKAAKTKLVPIVSSARAARLLAQKWMKEFNYAPDAFVVEGPKAGGHLGFKPEQLDDPAFALERLVAEVLVEAKKAGEAADKKIPVIAGGGVYSGADIHKLFQAGADGVQMATRFVTTVECDASDAFKDLYIQCEKEDIQIIKSPVGMPGRVIRNQFVEDVEAEKKNPFACPYHCLTTCKGPDSPFCIALALINAQKGRLSHGFAFAGDNAYRTDKIVTVKELVQDIQGEYAAACAE